LIGRATQPCAGQAVTRERCGAEPGPEPASSSATWTPALRCNA